MKIVNLKIDQIKPYEKNPRINSEAIGVVARSIQEFGFQQPLVLDKNHIIVVGHTRLLAAKSLGLKEVPCNIAEDLTEEEIKAYRILDNRSHDHSTWDKSLLLNELQSVFWDNNNFDLDFFSFETSFFDSTLKQKNSEDDKPKKKNKLLLKVECDEIENLEALYHELRDRGFTVTM